METGGMTWRFTRAGLIVFVLPFERLVKRREHIGGKDSFDFFLGAR
jgi:hypothetical protein